MFECQVDLLSLLPTNEKAIYYIVGKYDFDPKWEIDEEVWINWNLFDQEFHFKARVTERKKIIFPKGSHPEHKKESVYRLQIVVEAEDNNIMLNIREILEKHNPHLKKSQS